MSKRTKASKRRLNNLLIILLLTAVLLVMSTYAWFTANRTVRVDSLDVYVEATSGLQISANGSDWKTVLTKDDILYASSAEDTTNARGGYTNVINQMPANMAPVSTDKNLWDSVSGHNAAQEGQLKMFLGNTSTDLDDPTSTTYGHYLLYAAAQTDTRVDKAYPETATNTGSYMAFDIFLRHDQGSEDLYMSGSVAEMEDPVTGATTDKQLENSARIAIVKGDNTSDATNVTAVRALTTKGSTDIKMWEPNYDSHSSRSIENAALYGITAANNDGVKIAYSGIRAAYAIADEKVELYEANQTKHPTYFVNVTPDWYSKKSETPNFKMSALGAGATKYRVYLWVEGQDVDCQNYASGQYIVYNLSFSLDSFTSP